MMYRYIKYALGAPLPPPPTNYGNSSIHTNSPELLVLVLVRSANSSVEIESDLPPRHNPPSDTPPYRYSSLPFPPFRDLIPFHLLFQPHETQSSRSGQPRVQLQGIEV
jgi:hypothetical protein